MDPKGIILTPLFSHVILSVQVPADQLCAWASFCGLELGCGLAGMAGGVGRRGWLTQGSGQEERPGEMSLCVLRRK